MRLIPCACSHSPVDHEHYHAGDYCGRCRCPRYRPVRLRWYQFWRPRLALGSLTVFDLELLSARPEEIS